MLAGGSHPKDFALVRAAHRHIAGHKVAFADLVIDLVLDVRKSLAQGRSDRLDSVTALGNAWRRRHVLDDVRRADLVADIKSSLLERLDRDAPRNRLVLFYRHIWCLLSPAPYWEVVTD